jgi:hypothetical protein
MARNMRHFIWVFNSSASSEYYSETTFAISRSTVLDENKHGNVDLRNLTLQQPKENAT